MRTIFIAATLIASAFPAFAQSDKSSECVKNTGTATVPPNWSVDRAAERKDQ